jgi:hypothetical protein
MSNKFDELAKELAQSVTRRQALKRFSVGLAGMALACFGLANQAEAGDSASCLPEGAPCTFGTNPCCAPLKCRGGRSTVGTLFGTCTRGEGHA